MNRSSEKWLEPELKKRVEKVGGKCYKLLCLSLNGWPDRTIILPGGRVFFAEIKSTGKHLRRTQKIIKKLLESLGFVVFVIDSEDTLNNALKHMGC